MTRKSITDYVERDIDEYYNEACLHCGDPDCPGGPSTVESCMRLNRGVHGFVDLGEYPKKHIRIDDLSLGHSCEGEPFTICFPDSDALEAVVNLGRVYGFSVMPVYEWK